MTNKPGSQTNPDGAPGSIERELAAELDRKRSSPAAVYAGLGNVLTLLRETVLEQGRRLGELEAARRDAQSLLSTLTQVCSNHARRIAELEADGATLRHRMDTER